MSEPVMRGLSLLLLVLTACGEDAPPPPAPLVPEPVTPPPAPPAPAYELHEWGLVDVPAAGPAELSAGPGRPATLTLSMPAAPVPPVPPAPPPVRPPTRPPLPAPVSSRPPPPPTPPPPPMPMRKPVVYVHLLDGTTEVALDVELHVPGGSVIEHWPETGAHGDLVTWRGVSARACDALPVVPAFAGPCVTEDHYCERYDLPEYAASGAACLDVGGVAAPFLFYRGSSPVDAMPLRVTPASAGAIEIATGTELPAVRRVLRFLRTPGGLRVAEAEIPAGGGTFSIAEPTEPADRAALEASCRADLVAIGLTSSEADTFVRAWAGELFDTPAAREAPVVLGSYLVYWAPSTAMDRMAELTLTPAPRRVVRAIAVRVELP